MQALKIGTSPLVMKSFYQVSLVSLLRVARTLDVGSAD